METPGYVSVPGIDVVHYFTLIGHFFTSHTGTVFGAAQSIMGVIVAICIPITLFLLIAIVFTVEGLKHIRNLEEEKYGVEVEPAYIEEKVDKELAARWRKVVEHADSVNANDWKQAIIDADVMLDALLNKLGYQGESIGEKLKRASKGDFKTLDMAWDAHKVRNEIAHGGSDYEINQLEAKRVVGLYRQVFEEFYHISS